MNPGVSESPAVARRSVRLALRRAREAKGLTQGEVAAALEWSLSKVQRIEGGEVSISSTDLRAALELLGVTDANRVTRLVELARASRRRGWWDEAPYRDDITPATRQLLQFESQAQVIRAFQLTLVPGLLQTHGYAEAIFDFWRDVLTEEQRASRLDVRMRRPEHVFGRADPPYYLLILDESVILREIGSAAVMVEQLRHLLEAISNPRVIIRVAPLADAAPIAILGTFTLINLGDDDDAALYREDPLLDQIVQVPENVRRHRTVFEQMWERCLDQGASARLIEARAATLIASLDRRQPP